MTTKNPFIDGEKDTGYTTNRGYAIPTKVYEQIKEALIEEDKFFTIKEFASKLKLPITGKTPKNQIINLCNSFNGAIKRDYPTSTIRASVRKNKGGIGIIDNER